MTWMWLYLLVSAYLLGREEEKNSKQKLMDYLIILLWLPAIATYLSSLLAKKVLGD